MTLTAEKWRIGLYESAATFSEEVAEQDQARPAEEAIETLPLVIGALVKGFSDNGFTKQQIQDALLVGHEDAGDLIDRQLWERGAHAARARRDINSAFPGKLFAGAGTTGGAALIIGLCMMVVTLIVAAVGGSALVLAWVTIGLIVGGIGLLVFANKALDGLTRRRLRQIRLASERGRS